MVGGQPLNSSLHKYRRPSPYCSPIDIFKFDRYSQNATPIATKRHFTPPRSYPHLRTTFLSIHLPNASTAMAPESPTTGEAIGIVLGFIFGTGLLLCLGYYSLKSFKKWVYGEDKPETAEDDIEGSIVRA